MSSLSEKFDKFLASKTSKAFDPDVFGDEEREVHENEAIEVGRSRLRSSAPLFEQSAKYKGKKISRKELFGLEDDSEDSEDDEDVNNNTNKRISDAKNLTDKDRAMRLEETLNFSGDTRKMHFKPDFDNDEEKEEEEKNDFDDDDNDSLDPDDNDDDDNSDKETGANSSGGDDEDDNDNIKNKNIKLKQVKKKVTHKKDQRLNYDLEEDDDDEMNGSEVDEDVDMSDNEDGSDDDDDKTENNKGDKLVGEEETELRENASEAILKQYAIYDAFMDIRLSQQETLFRANQLPGPQHHALFRKALGQDFTDAVKKITSHYCDTLTSLLDFEDYTLKATAAHRKGGKTSVGDDGDDDDAEITSDEENDEDENGGKNGSENDGGDDDGGDDDGGGDDEDLTDGVKVRKMSINDEEEDDDDDVDDDDDDEVDNDENEVDDVGAKSSISKKIVNKKIQACKERLKSNNKVYTSYRQKILSGLSDKWRFSTQGSKDQGFQSFFIPVHKQIEQILQDKSRLLERTRMKRSVYKVLGVETAATEAIAGRKRMEAEDVEVFDDGDFYQKLLMEKTKRRTASATDMAFISKQWAELQRMRGAVKKDVDQKATKGRKTRYEVHKKMVGFMAPCKPKNLVSDQQIDAFLEHLASVHNQQDEKSA